MFVFSGTDSIWENASTNNQVVIGCVAFSVAVVNGVLPTPSGATPDTKPNEDCHIAGKFYTLDVLFGHKNTLNLLSYLVTP